MLKRIKSVCGLFKSTLPLFIADKLTCHSRKSTNVANDTRWHCAIQAAEWQSSILKWHLCFAYCNMSNCVLFKGLIASLSKCSCKIHFKKVGRNSHCRRCSASGGSGSIWSTSVWNTRTHAFFLFNRNTMTFSILS